jgi:hypothetical protein
MLGVLDGDFVGVSSINEGPCVGNGCAVGDEDNVGSPIDAGARVGTGPSDPEDFFDSFFIFIFPFPFPEDFVELFDFAPNREFSCFGIESVESSSSSGSPLLSSVLA